MFVILECSKFKNIYRTYYCFTSDYYDLQEEGLKPEAFDLKDESNKDLKTMLGDRAINATNTSIPITCQGKVGTTGKPNDRIPD